MTVAAWQRGSVAFAEEIAAKSSWPVVEVAALIACANYKHAN